MLKITRKVEYALIALRHMQQSPNNSVSSANQILSLIHISEPTRPLYISYAVFCLKKISLKDFFEKLEGPLGLMDCYFNTDCLQMKSCNILSPIQKINQNMRDMFSKTTLLEITQ